MVQVAARLPRQAVLVGHGVGALAVAQALARYPARAGVLVAPVFGGLATAAAPRCGATRPAPCPRSSAASCGCGAASCSAASCAAGPAKEYAGRVGRRAGPAGCTGSCWCTGAPRPPVGDPPVLVVGSPDDRVVPRRSLERVARRYGGAPLLFPGMGHDLMLDARWQEPIDAILDWLEKSN